MNVSETDKRKRLMDDRRTVINDTLNCHLFLLRMLQDGRFLSLSVDLTGEKTSERGSNPFKIWGDI